jgi:SAM-dependent methyltransferase
MTEVTTCPLCNGGDLRLFYEGVILGSHVRNLICARCALVFQSPRMTEQELAAYYAGPYRVEAQGTELPTQQKLAFEQARARHLADVAKRARGEVERHLDVGCAAGELLLATRRTFNCDTIGIEPSPAYAAHARAQGITVFQSLDEYDAHRGQRPDLVSLSHVLEHIANPIAFLSTIRDQILAPDGHLLIEVPNLFVHSAFEPAHLFAYHEATLTETLAAAGFDVAVSFTHNHPRRDPRPHYLTVIATPGERREVRRSASTFGVRVRRAYARSPIALAIHHPRFVMSGVVRRIRGGQTFAQSATH